MSIRISAERTIEDPRIDGARKNPVRNRYHLKGIDPLDNRIESTLGRMFLDNRVTEEEYNTGVRWRKIYDNWLLCIQAPAELSDEAAEAFEGKYKAGCAILRRLGRRVFDSVNAVCVYEQPEELGDFEFTAAAARKGLNALADLLLEDKEIVDLPALLARDFGLLDAPRQSARPHAGKSRSRAFSEFLPELKKSEARVVVIDCEENTADGSLEIRRYNSWDARF